ncbi:hypothetical protein B5180_40085, partial [Streptomyces sp. BF-3]
LAVAGCGASGDSSGSNAKADVKSAPREGFADEDGGAAASAAPEEQADDKAAAKKAAPKAEGTHVIRTAT